MSLGSQFSCKRSSPFLGRKSCATSASSNCGIPVSSGGAAWRRYRRSTGVTTPEKPEAPELRRPGASDGPPIGRTAKDLTPRCGYKGSRPQRSLDRGIPKGGMRTHHPGSSEEVGGGVGFPRELESCYRHARNAERQGQDVPDSRGKQIWKGEPRQPLGGRGSLGEVDEGGRSTFRCAPQSLCNERAALRPPLFASFARCRVCALA